MKHWSFCRMGAPGFNPTNISIFPNKRHIKLWSFYRQNLKRVAAQYLCFSNNVKNCLICQSLRIYVKGYSRIHSKLIYSFKKWSVTSKITTADIGRTWETQIQVGELKGLCFYLILSPLFNYTVRNKLLSPNSWPHFKLQ